MYKHDIWTLVLQHIAQSQQSIRCDIKERLIGPHNVQVILRLNAKDGKNGIEHLAMLASYAGNHIKATVAFKLPDNRTHLDGLWARPKNEENLLQNESLSQDAML